MFVGYMNLLPMTRDKKFANISSMHAPMDEDVPFAFPLRYGPSLSILGGLKAYMNLFM
ncbi:hypothetical protein Goklo_024133 [Gossypium klotzschianum]|uniref:Uncharacterized protein n=1 Tax=Gossypium klotzschianum TaxID=34286 RepID=A0A7J8W6K0_9ROSI|nr:hypothetical protein [Gossypium klotzschianum]